MRKHRNLEELLVSAVCGETDRGHDQELENLLADDEELQSEYVELKKTLELISQAKLAEDPHPEFWSGVWPEFLRRRKASAETNGVRQAQLAKPVWNWRPAVQVVIVAAMLVVGIFIGRILTEQELGRSAEEGMQAGEVPITLPYEREIAERKQDYFFEAAGSSIDKSSELIRNFMALEPQDWNKHKDIIARSREEGGEILNEITQLREGFGDPRFVEIEPILNELELFVGEIAGIEGGEDDVWFEIRSLQNGIRERNLLDRLNQLKVRVISQRGKDAGNPAIWVER
jgi:hypothetical protein